jgi:CRISPR-associated protein Cas1
MYALRLGEVLPHAEISVLRGLEGARVKQAYQVIADEYGIEWQGRRYDRVNPARTDIPNQAINHVATAVYAVAGVAVAVSGAIPQLGFIHEASGLAFVLDVADLIRESFTIPVAFSAAKECHAAGGRDIESFTRRVAGEQIRRRKIVSDMIDRIKELLDFE